MPPPPIPAAKRRKLEPIESLGTTNGKGKAREVIEIRDEEDEEELLGEGQLCTCMPAVTDNLETPTLLVEMWTERFAPTREVRFSGCWKH